MGNTSNRIPDCFHFKEKGGKDSKQQLKLLKETRKKKQKNAL